MESLQSFFNLSKFLISNLTPFGMLDLLLVAGTFYLLLSLIRRSSAAYLLREILVIGLVLFVLTALLPLPVFDWLVRGILVAMLVATPIIFQAPLRRFLERVGRTAGIAQSVRQGTAETVLPELVHAVEDMAASKTGALLVLEGYDSLEEIAKSGVGFGGRVTSELLLSVFYSGTPLHDGAVLIRTDRIVAAGCVLPLTQQTLQAEKRLGTRHRAAVGLSETSDALVIVVSEETGAISVAQHGNLERPFTILDLRERLVDFYEPSSTTRSSLSLWSLFGQAGRQFWHPEAFLSPRRLLSNLGLLMISVLLSFVVWSFVIELKQVRIENIPLRIENVPANARLIPTPPAGVTAIVQTTEDVLPSLNSRSFQAFATLQTSQPGLYRLPVHVNSGPAQVLVVSVDPGNLDLELAPIITRTLPIVVNVPDIQNLSAAHELVGTPAATPVEVQVVGPQPLVEQISQVQTTISVANVTTSIRETRPLQALNEQGQEVKDITIQPAQVQVSLIVRRRLNASNASVNVIMKGSPPSAFEVSSVTVTPANVTLQGSFEQLSEVGSFVNTLPVDLSQAKNDLIVQIPLDLPPNIQALDNSGNIANPVTVSIRIVEREGNLSLTRPVELLQATPGITTSVVPPTVNVLLNGPLSVLDEIESDPNLVQVVVDTATLLPGRNASLNPTFIGPPGVEAQLVPSVVLVSFE